MGERLLVTRCGGGRRQATVVPRAPARRLADRRESVAVESLHPLATLLSLQSERGSGSGEQPRDADRLAGLLAVAVRPVVDHAQRLLDLLEQLALTIARAQLEGVFLLERRAIRGVGGDLVLAQVLAGVVGVLQQLIAQLDKLCKKHLLEEKPIYFEMLSFLKTWLKDHIQGVDTKYSAALQQAGFSVASWEKEATEEFEAMSNSKKWWEVWKKTG